MKKLMKRMTGAALALILAVGVSACGGNTGDNNSESGSGNQTGETGQQAETVNSLKDIVVANGTDASTLDPHLCTDSATEVINKNIYNNLVRYDKNMDMAPDLATEWSIGEDGVTWKFQLRQGVTFHDGTDFNAAAVKVNIERLLAEETGSARRSVLEMVDSVNPVGDYEVEIITSYPCGSFLQQLAHPAAGMASPDAIAQYGLDLGQNPCGTGPLMLNEWSHGEKLVFDAFPDFYEGRPQFNSVTFLIIPEASSRSMLLESGQCDIALRLSVSEIDRLRDREDLIIEEGPTVMTMYVALNNSKGPLQDVRVRQALNYAVDIDSIVTNVVSDFSVAADSVISPYTWGYSSVGGYGYDPEKAQSLLAEAGYGDGLEITLWTPTGRYLMDKEVAEALQAQVAAVGIDLKIQQWEFQALMSEVQKGEFDAVLLGWSPSTADADQGLYPVFHSTQFPPQSNRAFYNNPEVDGLLADAKIEVDPVKRAELYAKAQETIVAEAAWIMLYYPNQAIVTSKEISGIEMIPTEHLLFNQAVKY